jgi:hypothetical protein
MGNSVRHYLGYGYGLVWGHVPFGPPVINSESKGGKVHTLRIQNQAKQVVHSGPPISIGFSKEQSFSNIGPRARK